MDTILWIFYNILPWFGLIYLVLGALFLLFASFNIHSEIKNGEEQAESAFDLTTLFCIYSFIVAFFHLALVFIVFWPVYKIRDIKLDKEIESMR
jgi:amino acid transporter